MQFGSPSVLWLLLIVPAVIWFYFIAWKKNRELITKFVHPNLMDTLTGEVSFKIKKWKMALVICSFIFLILAAARPQWGFKWEEVKQRGLDIIVAIDTSRSMLAEDIKPNRLTRAKLAALDLISIAKSDRLGLVTFAGIAFLQCPFTLDDEAFRQSVNVLDVDIMPQGGTAIGEAIKIAAEAFKEGTENHRIIVIFTDGEDLEGNAIDAAGEAAKKGIKIFTVGVGTPEGETLRVMGKNGKMETVLDENRRPVVSRLNQNLLQEIAAKTGGFYLQLTGAKTIETLYERGIAPLPKGEQSARWVKKFNERFYILLLIAILLLIVEMFLPERKTSFKIGKIAGNIGVFLFVICIINFNSANASLSSAIKNFNEKKYKTALHEFEDLLKKKPDDPKLSFNVGAAAYMIDRYEVASNYFALALNAPKNPELQQKALYNMGNTLYRIGEKEQDLSKRYEQWKLSTNYYAAALKFNPKDKNAQFNYEFVKKKIEELEKQLPKQNQQQKDNNKEDKQQKENEKNQKDKNEQQQKNNQQQKDQQQKEQEEQQKQQQAQQKQQGKQDNQQQAQQNKQGETNSQGMAETKAVYMTPEQVQKLLEAQKSEEKPLIFIPPESDKQKNTSRNFKNW